MRRVIYFPAFCFLLSASAQCQVLHVPIQVPGIHPGAYSLHFQNAFSFGSNQAALASRLSLSAAAFTSQNFQLKELSFSELSGTVPAVSGALALQFLYTGSPDYHESKLGLAYGRRLGKWVDLGVQFDAYGFAIAGYGHALCIQAELGILLHPSEKMTMGLQVINPGGSHLGKASGERLASIYKTGIGYEASRQVYFQLELIKTEQVPINAVASFEYMFADHFFAALGILTLSGSPFGFAGWAWKSNRLQISAQYHPQLGFTPGISLFFEPPSASLPPSP